VAAQKGRDGMPKIGINCVRPVQEATLVVYWHKGVANETGSGLPTKLVAVPILKFERVGILQISSRARTFLA